MALMIGVLGPLRVAGPEGIVEVERPAQRRVLSLLALAAGHRVSTDVLIDRFWPGRPPETARAAIQTHLSALRRQLGDDLVITEGYGYRLNLDRHKTDADELTQLAARISELRGANSWDAAAESVDEATGLWRGEPFVELAGDEFARPEISRLTELYLGVLETRAECLIALDREQDVLPDLEALVIQHPYRERLWEHLMTARYRLGRHAEALEAFQEISNHLAEIGVEPGERLHRLEEKILLHDQSLTGSPSNLPVELDQFVGRGAEINQVAELLAKHRLVTLTGPGGSGKTRLAIHIARQLLDRHPDGVHYVELADIDDAAQVPSQILIAVGLTGGDEQPLPMLQRALATDKALLILDNCEHLIEAVGRVVAPLLRAAPRLTVLATTRQPIRVQGEVLYPVPGLGLPNDTEGHDAASTDAVQLFANRARQVDPSFDLAGAVGPVVRICRRLDAMPLGIELAAARVNSLGVDKIEAHLDGSLGLLTSGDPGGHPRHQTLRAATEWSYRLATDEEQRALAVLSVFRGGFDLDMAVWMLGDSAPRLIAELVDQSLVTTLRGRRGRRYRLLETIRQFGLEKGVELGLAEESLRKHSEWCASFVDRIWQSWQQPGMDQMQLAIHEEFENLVSAFDRAEAVGDRELGGEIAAGLLWHWQDLGYWAKSLEFYERALATCDDPERRVGLLAKRVGPRFNLNDPEGAYLDAKTAHELAISLPSSVAKAYAISGYGHIFGFGPDLDAREGMPYLEEAVTIAEETGNDLLIAVLNLDLALAYGWAGDEARALPALDKAVAMVEETGDPITVAYTYVQATTVVMQFADARRQGLGYYSDRLTKWFDDHPQIAPEFRMGWLEWAAISRGELVEIEARLREWAGEKHLEGFHKIGNLVPLGVAIWMQGRLEDALEIVDECEAVGVNPRWYHDFYPLKVDVLTDMGRWDAACAAAEDYLSFDSDPGESAKKLGVLNPLVRGMADQSGTSAEPADVARRAASLIERMKGILADHPPPMDGSVSMETHITHLRFAEAELTRITGPDPGAWRAAMEAADYLYFRLYAQIRLGEALFASGQGEEGRAQIEDAVATTRRIGAAKLTDLAKAILRL